MSQINNESSPKAEGQDLPSEVPVEEEEKSFDSSRRTAEQFSEEELDIYKRVLEKLGPVSESKAEAPFSQEKFMQESDSKKETALNQRDYEVSKQRIQVEKIVAQDFEKIQKLTQLGLINSAQEQNLKQQVLKKAFGTVLQSELIQQNSPSASGIENSGKNVVFSDFHRENPDFFSAEGRGEVLDYLKSDEVIIGKGELKKISSMVENLEKAAVERYLKKEAYKKNLNDSNEVAKQKLTSNAQNNGFQDKNVSRTFTREQIGKMSGAEFTKYESLIMEQLKKGLIR